MQVLVGTNYMLHQHWCHFVYSRAIQRWSTDKTKIGISKSNL